MIIKIITAIMLILSGTIAGYITNKYAVKWLFKPVTIFGKKVFDVSILSTDEKQTAFIDSLSDCVEQKILTNEVLKKEIVNDTLKSHIDEIVEYFLVEALPDSFKSVKISELNGYHETNLSLKDSLSHILDENTDPLLIQILEEIKVSDYLTEVQIISGTENLYESMKHAFSSNPSIKEQIGHILPELLFASMFNSDARSALGKLAAKLFKGMPSTDMSSMTLPEKIGSSVKKIISSLVSGFVEDKSVNSYAKDDTREIICKKLKTEILNRYDSLSENIADNSVSSISKLISGNENIKTTISDMIFDYINKNTNKLLGGRVKETVSMALGRLDPDQLCDVAQKLLKGELKYLSYFGGALGFLISIPALLITLGSFNATGFPNNPLMSIFLIALMGFIGVITNIIAIKMFFHPYKQIKALAGSKHTKAFSQGLILQNQPIFAHTLGEYIGNELLTSNNIEKMLESHKEAFISQLSSKIYPYIFEYLSEESTKRELSAKISAFLMNKAYENRETVSDYLSEGLGKKTFGSIIDINDPDIRSKAIKIYVGLLNKASVPPDESLDEDAYDFKFIAYALSNIIKNSESLTDKVWHLLETFYITEISDRNILDFFSMSLLSDSMQVTISKICQNDESFKAFRESVNNCLYKLTDKDENVLSDEFINDISQKCAESVYNAAINQLPSLVEDTNIAEITEKKVASLEPEEIKKVVMSFASPVFNKLYALGCIGCFFGINTYLAFILYIIDKATDR